MEMSFTSSSEKSGFKGDKILFLFVGIIIFLLLAFVGLTIYNAQLKGKIDFFEAEITRIDSERDKKLEKTMKGSILLLDKSKVILESHTRAKNIFDLLEKKTFQEVEFTDFNFIADDNILVISAQSTNDKAISFQVSILESLPEIESVTISGITKQEDSFKFQLVINLNDALTRFSYKVK
ncbi:MAG: hypothetical protein V1841_01680 [Patescibacteria group bacterium]